MCDMSLIHCNNNKLTLNFANLGIIRIMLYFLAGISTE